MKQTGRHPDVRTDGQSVSGYLGEYFGTEVQDGIFCLIGILVWVNNRSVMKGKEASSTIRYASIITGGHARAERKGNGTKGKQGKARKGKDNIGTHNRSYLGIL